MTTVLKRVGVFSSDTVPWKYLFSFKLMLNSCFLVPSNVGFDMSLYQFLKVSLDPFGYIVGRANSFQGISGRLFDFFLSELTNSIWLTGLIFIRTNSQLSLASFVDPQGDAYLSSEPTEPTGSSIRVGRVCDHTG